MERQGKRLAGNAGVAMATSCDLPALWKPKPNQFVHVDSIPTLGTGKMDLRAIKALATEMAAGFEAEA